MHPIPSSMKNFIDPPPVPPTPISPLDHVVEMAKKNAIFYHEGKEISSDKAIDIIKKNKKINIDTRGSNNKRPVVKLSTEPIVIEN
jgi:Tfp pilus assembly protein PilW